MGLRTAASIVAASAIAAAGCTATGGGADVERTAAMEQRIAAVEGRLAAVEGAAAAPAPVGPETAEVARPAAAEKRGFEDALDADAVEAEVAAKGDVVVDVARLELDGELDLLKVTVDVEEGSDDDAAWQVAVALADLWTPLLGYAPALELDVASVRCFCSASLMKGIADERVDRDVWSGACAEV